MGSSGRTRDMHLTEEESTVIVEEIVDQTTVPSSGSLILVGSLLSSRPFNTFPLKATMKGAWRARKGFVFRELRNNLFIFQFADVGDKERVLKGGPWAFEKSLLVLREPGSEQPSSMRFDKAEFWIRFYDLPVTMMNANMAKKLGAVLGKVTEVDETDFLMCGRFLRVRALIDLTKPIRRGVMILCGEHKLWIEIKYERLPNFCYACGLLGHVDLDCEDEEARGLQNEYGDWLRASPLKVVDRSNVEKAKEQEILQVLKGVNQVANVSSSSNPNHARKSLFSLLDMADNVNANEEDGVQNARCMGVHDVVAEVSNLGLNVDAGKQKENMDMSTDQGVHGNMQGKVLDEVRKEQDKGKGVDLIGDAEMETLTVTNSICMTDEELQANLARASANEGGLPSKVKKKKNWKRIAREGVGDGEVLGGVGKKRKEGERDCREDGENGLNEGLVSKIDEKKRKSNASATVAISEREEELLSCRKS